MAREKFLEQVADYYLRKDHDLAHTTFVFPNRRSAMYLRKYMQQGAKKPQFMPKMVSITRFVQDLNDAQLATDAELVFILYRVYCRVLERHNHKDQVPDFDRFYFWGRILLNDFNDIDAYMVDAHELYRNLRDLKEIQADYLTTEQREVINYLWGGKMPVDDQGSPDVFWRHMPAADQKSADEFINLWEISAEIYDEFVAELDSRPVPLAYSGLQSRRALQRVRESGVEDFRGMRYVFVGFNVLSTARTLIFKRLRDLGIADFFWDVASVDIAPVSGVPNSSGRFILPLAKAFPMPEDFELQPVTNMPEIEIISVPSNYGQTKVASAILNDWAKDAVSADARGEDTPHSRPASGAIPPEWLTDTAVILADECLLMPMLHSISPDISPVNVTSGVPYSTTPFAALMSAVISMHLRARISRGRYLYYYQDVVEILQNPHIAMLWPVESRELHERIMHDHLYSVPADEIIRDYPALAFLFTQLPDQGNLADVRRYIDTVVDTLRDALSAHVGDRDESQFYEIAILDGYALTVGKLCALMERYEVKMHERTFLQIIERTMALTPMNFAGRPLVGLQLMSIMDTRTIDFKRLIMLSMNERVFPKHNYTPSLIPATLRCAFCMPTQEYEESSYAYQFYRLISRAGQVKLLYDSRTSGISSGEMSRYLSQLIHIPAASRPSSTGFFAKQSDCVDDQPVFPSADTPRPIKHTTVEFQIHSDDTPPITIHKTPEVMRELAAFLPGGPLKISASALKTYLTCPLKFYLQYVRGLRGNDDTMGYIDAASYGTVIHRIVQVLYEAHAGQLVNPELLDVLIASDIETLAAEILDKEYYRGRYEHHLEDMPGEGRVVARIIAEYVRRMFEQERVLAQVPYRFEHGEYGEHIKHEWRVNDRYTINFTMSIDRIDITRDPQDPSRSSLRFIDYKTGSDSLSAKSVDEVFTNKDCGGIFQLLLYCQAYADIYHDDRHIQPLIYKMQTMATDGIKPITIAKRPIIDYRQADDIGGENYRQRLEQVIDHIFTSDDSHPFDQCADIDHCLYCPFTQMCGRYPQPPKTRD